MTSFRTSRREGRSDERDTPNTMCLPSCRDLGRWGVGTGVAPRIPTIGDIFFALPVAAEAAAWLCEDTRLIVILLGQEILVRTSVDYNLR